MLYVGRILLLALSGLVSSLASAQIQFPLSQPIFKVGEVAKYRTIDLWKNIEISTHESEVIEISDVGLVMRRTSSTNAAPVDLSFNRSSNPCRALQNSDKKVCDGSIKFPLQLGNKYDFKDLPWTDGKGITSMRCEVKGEEKLSLKAGNFDTVRIECAGFWTRLFDGRGVGKTSEYLWYAPIYGRFVKIQFSTWDDKGGLDLKTQTELVEFIPAK